MLIIILVTNKFSFNGSANNIWRLVLVCIVTFLLSVTKSECECLICKIYSMKYKWLTLWIDINFLRECTPTLVQVAQKLIIWKFRLRNCIEALIMSRQNRLLATPKGIFLKGMNYLFYGRWTFYVACMTQRIWKIKDPEDNKFLNNNLG